MSERPTGDKRTNITAERRDRRIEDMRAAADRAFDAALAWYVEQVSR